MANFPLVIRKLLVANRGEIARRIFRTCREMGIATVAVFSDADRHQPFVAEAEEGVALGGASPTESYLRIEAVVEAARRSGADAVHPGYGFLAENAAFAQAAIDAGLTWVGPAPSSIAAMGSKLESKRIVEGAGVPTVPSVDLARVDDLVDAANLIGWPVLVKASAGGGGKGMRIVRNPAELAAAVESGRREAASAFGDETVFFERYLEAPRHLEVQVLGDIHGNLVSLFERECSIQRRHQKIVEESPSPAVDEELRARLSKAAVAVARAVAYVGAGTVEFLFDGGEFFFLEMNTRLQVEHPVTEEVTGLDLVRLQLLVAAGAPLPEEALDPVMLGHAIEARLYAEDPRQNFLPVTGHFDRVRFPERRGLRVDIGVADGTDVSIHYDPMLGKLVAWAETRAEAAFLLADSLQHAELHGPTTNRELLVRILRHPEFLEGRTDTHFLERHDPVTLGAPLPDAQSEELAAVAAALASQAGRRITATVQASIPSGWRNSPSQTQRARFSGAHGDIDVGYRFDGWTGLHVDGHERAILHACTPEQVGLEVDDHLWWFRVQRVGNVHHIDGPFGYSRLVEHGRFPAPKAEEAPGSLHAPMPGKVVKVLVAEGTQVEEGAVLVVIEAMKMEHTLRAPHRGTVTLVRVGEGDQVDADEILVVLAQ